MKFTGFALVTLLSTCVQGATVTWNKASQLERRRIRSASRGGDPVMDATAAPSGSIQYDGNWAGAVQQDHDISYVSANVIVPSVTIPAGGSKNATYGASWWVGIDGYTCNTTIAQTGIEAWIFDGKVSYDAWFQWYPGPEKGYPNEIKIHKGDSITMAVHAPTNTTGNATIINHTTGKMAFHEFTPQISDPLCRTNAEWIVEDFDTISGLVTLVDYGNTSITNASYVAGGKSKDLTGAQVLGIKTLKGHKIDTTCSLADAMTVDCRYI